MTDLALPMAIPSLPVLSEVPSPAFSHPLSHILRVSTQLAHKEVEVRLALPGSILSLSDYQACLIRFYQLYTPMELQFKRFSEWSALGLDPLGCSISVRLAADLQALNVFVPGITCAPAISLPRLLYFANALGACYVIEGSALGSQFMLPQLQQVLGEGMTGADSFFRGRGSETAAFWKRFRAVLDLYGETHPEQVPSVVASAISTFKAIGLWMRP
jgi:heme oxygenase